jgi:hypothetical protein
MSHEIPAKNPDHIVIVGWDGVLLTYFADVFDRDGYALVRKIGKTSREIRTISDLRARARRFGEFDETVWAKLKRDKGDGQ